MFFPGKYQTVSNPTVHLAAVNSVNRTGSSVDSSSISFKPDFVNASAHSPAHTVSYKKFELAPYQPLSAPRPRVLPELTMPKSLRILRNDSCKI
jgi:hypothetical protein